MVLHPSFLIVTLRHLLIHDTPILEHQFWVETQALTLESVHQGEWSLLELLFLHWTWKPALHQWLKLHYCQAGQPARGTKTDYNDQYKRYKEVKEQNSMVQIKRLYENFFTEKNSKNLLQQTREIINNTRRLCLKESYIILSMLTGIMTPGISVTVNFIKCTDQDKLTGPLLGFEVLRNY